MSNDTQTTGRKTVQRSFNVPSCIRWEKEAFECIHKDYVPNDINCFGKIDKCHEENKKKYSHISKICCSTQTNEADCCICCTYCAIQGMSSGFRPHIPPTMPEEEMMSYIISEERKLWLAAMKVLYFRYADEFRALEGCISDLQRREKVKVRCEPMFKITLVGLEDDDAKRLAKLESEFRRTHKFFARNQNNPVFIPWQCRVDYMVDDKDKEKFCEEMKKLVVSTVKDCEEKASYEEIIDGETVHKRKWARVMIDYLLKEFFC